MERIPIITILGHVDHGKTTMLDYIRNAHVQSGEVGGITQKISAFTVTIDGRKLTFIDTPGHEAFDLMRLRGGTIADIVLLIVAADDGVMPQTEESIEIIKKSKAKPIVVITKVDLPGIELEKIKRDVTNKGIFVEGMGGNVPVVEISAKSGLNIDRLLETIILVADVEGLNERMELLSGVEAKGFVLESVKDKSMGHVSTVIITQGDVKKGMWIGYISKGKTSTEKVKGVTTEEGNNLDGLPQGTGGKIIGLSQMVELGSEIFFADSNNEQLLPSLIAQDNIADSENTNALDLSALFGTPEATEKKTLKVVVKASSEGALEALRKSLGKIDDEGYTVEIIRDGLGDINIKDVEMAEITKSIVLGFEVGLEKGVGEVALKKKILVKTYDLIYKLVDEISDAIVALSTPSESEEEIGSANVKAIFVLSNGKKVIGCRVAKGIMKKGCKLYVVRGDDIILESRIDTIKHEKSSITEAGNGTECGILLEDDGDIKEGDTLYCYKIIK